MVTTMLRRDRRAPIAFSFKVVAGREPVDNARIAAILLTPQNVLGRQATADGAQDSAAVEGARGPIIGSGNHGALRSDP